MTQTELKPCPFCGWEAVAHESWISCVSCEIEGPYYDTLNEAIAAWNTRTITPAEAALPDVDAMANIIRAVDGNHTLGAGALAERIIAALTKGAKPNA